MSKTKTQTKKKGSFRRNVILTFLAISLISLSVTGYISLLFTDFIGGTTTDQSTAALSEQIRVNLELTAKKNAEVITQKLANAEAMVKAMAEEAEYIFSDTSTFEPRKVYYDWFFEFGGGPIPSDIEYDSNYGLNVSWDYSSWYHRDADPGNYLIIEAAYNDSLQKASNLDFIFKSIHQQMPEFRWLYMGFENGLFFNYPGSLLDRSVHPYTPANEYWYDVIDDGQGDIVFVEPYYDEFDGVLLISIGKVVRFTNGSTIGVISADIPVTDINEKILDVTVLETGYAALIQADGGVIAHPELQSEDYALGPPALLDVETGLTISDRTAILSGQTDLLTYTKNGEDQLLAYTPVGKGGYICIISVPLSEALEAIPLLETRIAESSLAATTFILGITVAGIIIAGAVAAVVAGQITKPLGYLMDLAMRNVSARIRQQDVADLDLKVDRDYLTQSDEIGELARAFQGMLDTIAEEEES